MCNLDINTPIGIVAVVVLSLTLGPALLYALAKLLLWVCNLDNPWRKCK